MPSTLETEQAAMTGDRQAILVVVSSLRKYRAATKKLLESRYQDGECDAVALHVFNLEAGEAEEDLNSRE